MSPAKITIPEVTTCRVPLCCIKQCAFRKCPDDETSTQLNYEIEDPLPLEKIDPYWADLLKEQQYTKYNNIFKYNIYGDSKDPTQRTVAPFPVAIIKQRVSKMPLMAGLKQKQMFYMLNIILNLSLHKPERQKEFLTILQKHGFLTCELLQYLQIIAHHPNTGLDEYQRKVFQRTCYQLLKNSYCDSQCDLKYFNPDHLFSKPLDASMDPYELEYLRTIMESCRKKLSQSEYMYLICFIERLHELPTERRQQYLNILHGMGIIHTCKFSTLLFYLKPCIKPIDRKALRLLSNALEDLLQLGPCGPRKEVPDSDADSIATIDFHKKMIEAYKKMLEIKEAEERARLAAEEEARRLAEEALRKAEEALARAEARRAAINKFLLARNERLQKDSTKPAKKQKKPPESEEELEQEPKPRRSLPVSKESTDESKKKGKGGKAKGKGKKGKKAPAAVKPETPTQEDDNTAKEEECVRNIRFTSYPLCQTRRRCPATRPAIGCPDPDTSFTCLCPRRTTRPATPSREERLYACDGTVLIFPRFR